MEPTISRQVGPGDEATEQAGEGRAGLADLAELRDPAEPSVARDEELFEEHSERRARQ